VHYKIRGKKPHKVYLASFCCFTTKAVRLEVVSDLTTQAFLAALKRFNGGEESQGVTTKRVLSGRKTSCES